MTLLSATPRSESEIRVDSTGLDAEHVVLDRSRPLSLDTGRVDLKFDG